MSSFSLVLVTFIHYAFAELSFNVYSEQCEPPKYKIDYGELCFYNHNCPFVIIFPKDHESIPSGYGYHCYILKDHGSVSVVYNNNDTFIIDIPDYQITSDSFGLHRFLVARSMALYYSAILFFVFLLGVICTLFSKQIINLCHCFLFCHAFYSICGKKRPHVATDAIMVSKADLLDLFERSSFKTTIPFKVALMFFLIVCSSSYEFSADSKSCQTLRTPYLKSYFNTVGYLDSCHIYSTPHKDGHYCVNSFGSLYKYLLKSRDKLINSVSDLYDYSKWPPPLRDFLYTYSHDLSVVGTYMSKFGPNCTHHTTRTETINVVMPAVTFSKNGAITYIYKSTTIFYCFLYEPGIECCENLYFEYGLCCHSYSYVPIFNENGLIFHPTFNDTGVRKIYKMPFIMYTVYNGSFYIANDFSSYIEHYLVPGFLERHGDSFLYFSYINITSDFCSLHTGLNYCYNSMSSSYTLSNPVRFVCSYDGSFIGYLAYFNCINRAYFFLFVIIFIVPLFAWISKYILLQVYHPLTKFSAYRSIKKVDVNAKKLKFDLYSYYLWHIDCFIRYCLSALYPFWFFVISALSFIFWIPYLLIILYFKCKSRSKKRLWFLMLYPFCSTKYQVSAAYIPHIDTYSYSNSLNNTFNCPHTFCIVSNGSVVDPYGSDSMYSPPLYSNFNDTLGVFDFGESYKTLSGTAIERDLTFYKINVISEVCNFSDKRICRRSMMITSTLPTVEGSLNLISSDGGGLRGRIKFKNFRIKYDSTIEWSWASGLVRTVRRVSDCYASSGGNNPIRQRSDHYCGYESRHISFNHKGDLFGSGPGDDFGNDFECTVYEKTLGRFYDHPIKHYNAPAMCSVETPCTGDGCGLAWQCRSYLNYHWYENDFGFYVVAFRLTNPRLVGEIVIDDINGENVTSRTFQINQPSAAVATKNVKLTYDFTFKSNYKDKVVATIFKGDHYNLNKYSTISYIVGSYDDDESIFSYKCKDRIPFPHFSSGCRQYTYDHLKVFNNIDDLTKAMDNTYVKVDQSSNHCLLTTLGAISIESEMIGPNHPLFQHAAIDWNGGTNCKTKKAKYYKEDGIRYAKITSDVCEACNLDSSAHITVVVSEDIMSKSYEDIHVYTTQMKVLSLNFSGTWDRVDGGFITFKAPGFNLRVLFTLVVHYYSTFGDISRTYGPFIITDGLVTRVTHASRNVTKVIVLYQSTLIREYNDGFIQNIINPPAVIGDKRITGGNDNNDLRDGGGVSNFFKDLDFDKVGNFFSGIIDNWQRIVIVIGIVIVCFFLFFFICNCISARVGRI